MSTYQHLAPAPGSTPRSITPAGSVKSSSSTSSPPQSIPTEKRKYAIALLHKYERTPKDSPTNSPGPEETNHHERRRVSLNQHSSSQHLSPNRQHRKSDEPMLALPDMMSTLKFSNKPTVHAPSAGGRKKPLDKKRKAKAALIRHLGACPTCKRRKVTCSLDHHDLASLRNTMEGVDDAITVVTEDTSPTISPNQMDVPDFSWGSMDRGSARADPFIYGLVEGSNDHAFNFNSNYDFNYIPTPPEIIVEQAISHTGSGAINSSFNDPTLFSGLQDDSSIQPDYHQALLETDLFDDENFNGSDQTPQVQHIQEPGYQNTHFAYSPIIGSHLSMPEALPPGEYFNIEPITNIVHIGTRDESGERPRYTCSNDGCCDTFGNIVRLQDHYSRWHTHFQELLEPERLVCQRCNKFLSFRDDTCPYCNHNFLLVHVYGSDTSSFRNEPLSATLPIGDAQPPQHQQIFGPLNQFHTSMDSFNGMYFNDHTMNEFSHRQRHHARHSRKYHAQHQYQSSPHRTRRCVLYDHHLTTDLLHQPFIRVVITVVLTAWALSLSHGIRIGLSYYEAYISACALDISHCVLTVTLVLLSISLWQVSTLLLDRRRRNDHGRHCPFQRDTTV